MASPEFLLLVEASETPDPEPLTDEEHFVVGDTASPRDGGGSGSN